jgi:biofilm PGA synthesis lipoprotein PgaB
MKRFLIVLGLLLLALDARAELLVLRFADIVAEPRDAGRDRLSREQLTARFDWLADQGYTPISLQQLVDARAGRGTLPERPLLLSFDGGYRSLESEVRPLLRAFGWPAIAALPTARIGVDADRLDWAALRRIADDGSIELISAGHALDQPWPRAAEEAPLPAPGLRHFEGSTLESSSAFAARIAADLQLSREAIAAGIGRTPRAVAWPGGAWTPLGMREAQLRGLDLGFDLAGRAQHPDALPVMARLDVASEASLADFVAELAPRRAPAFRAVQVDLDYVFDADPAQLERNLDALIARIDAIAPTHVWLQAFADPDGDGAADAVYFGNRHLPVQAELFTRVAELLRRKTGVEVHAWLPALGWRWPQSDNAPRAIRASNAGEIPRLDPTDPRTAARIGELYADLAARAPIQGLLFHDDAFLREDELREALPDDAARVNALVEFTRTLQAAAESERPRLRTARNLYARPLLEPASVAWFAQDHASMLAAYDRVALMAMPRMEGARDGRDWLLELAAAVEGQDAGFERTVFVLQARDWSTRSAIDDAELIDWARQLRARGVRHLAYYPDDFISGQPGLQAARAIASARRFPYLRGGDALPAGSGGGR